MFNINNEIELFTLFAKTGNVLIQNAGFFTLVYLPKYINDNIKNSIIEMGKYIDEKSVYNEEMDVNILIEAFKKFLDRKELEKPLKTKITSKEYSVKERKDGIRKLLQTRKKVEFKELFDIVNKGYIAVTFLSILEMTKEKVINIKQDKNFDNIYLEMR